MFNKRPINLVRNQLLPSCFQVGYEALIAVVEMEQRRLGKNQLVLAIDGTHGASFKRLENELKERSSDKRIAFISTGDFLKTGENLRKQFAINITDNRAFGYVAEPGIEQYFQLDTQVRFEQLLDEKLQAGYSLVVLIGTGAHWIGGKRCDLHLFADISRELQQTKHKEGLLNFGMSRNTDHVEKYKIALFVEWPILEDYRKRHFLEYDYYLDINDETSPVFTTIPDLVAVIKDISKYPFRVKPFFAPGVWGGQYLKEIAGLPQDMVNCAWGFEPIAPENSILIAHDGKTMEIPFLLMMAVSFREILGRRIVELFNDYFPVRFDYLDTIGGTNLSCQVHGKREFLREHFNEFMEQQESYYIMEQEKGSKVYLGFTEQAEGEQFLAAVNTSQETGVPFDFTEYVQEWECDKGDLFLIPTGTVHCSGKGNLVLEISSTTWWYTFKIYDYVRKDLDGKPRPINIDFAEKNLDFDKKTKWVKQNLLPRPRLIQQQGDNEEYLLGKREDLLFFVHRIHLRDRFEDDTHGEFMMLNLVEGERIKIVSAEDPSVFVELSYAEAYILPSVFGAFHIVNLGETPCKIIKAGVSPDWSERWVHE